MTMLRSIDIFAGCGGLCDGFVQSGRYQTLAAVEWNEAPVNVLRKRLSDKWGMDDAEKRVIRFDVQRTDELIRGWTGDEEYGSCDGLEKYIDGSLDVVIGGPPCQAYSIAGRVRDKNGMRLDYRNYLFESYIRVIRHFEPKIFVFENVPGILSARPGDGSFKIIDRIRDEFDKAGYAVLSDLSKAVVDMTEYGVPQNRKRIIILGLNKKYYGGSKKCGKILYDFYTRILPFYKSDHVMTVRDAISDLPKLFPLEKDIRIDGHHLSHSLPELPVDGHIPRYHSQRDIKIFRMLAEDILSGERKYESTEALKELYTKVTGKVSNVHKYHVCEWDKPSNLIPAHLYKDGLRHIHPDPEQARTITVREAARLQTFDDDFCFGKSMTEAYKMIGNAVPPLFAKKLALAVSDMMEKYSK
jgi:DNA (cytosine-5)-methyltransferase 1